MIILPVERRLNWNHPPLVLLGIIVLNVLIFFMYQSGDSARYISALEAYNEADFLDTEWPHYQTYLQQEGETELREELQEYYEDGDLYPVLAHLVSDREFYHYLEREGPSLFYPSFYYDWVESRADINRQLESISSIRFGLKPNDLSVIDLLAYQFLHGDFLHLLGNMMFLMICGFVVEAALGHLPFLGLYLLSGVVAGLAHAAMDFSSEQPLVGASGSLSAVMAMYLMIYRWQKIRFFYWFYLIVGYFRAPAIILLPVYIGKELIDFYTDTESNVAFMAHAGGFVAGAISLGVLAYWRPSILKLEYIDTPDDDSEQGRQQLAGIYDALEKYRFDTALQRTEQALNEQGDNFELLNIRQNILKLTKNKTWLKSLERILAFEDVTEKERQQQYLIWRESRSYAKHIDSTILAAAAINFSYLDDLTTSEELFALLQRRNIEDGTLQRVANYLAKAFSRKNMMEKQQAYIALASAPETDQISGARLV